MIGLTDVLPPRYPIMNNSLVRPHDSYDHNKEMGIGQKETESIHNRKFVRTGYVPHNDFRDLRTFQDNESSKKMDGNFPGTRFEGNGTLRPIFDIKDPHELGPFGKTNVMRRLSEIIREEKWSFKDP